MDREKLYNRLDEDEELTDQERREYYDAEIDNEQDEEDWKNGY